MALSAFLSPFPLLLALLSAGSADAHDRPCPAGAISVEPGGLIQGAVDRGGEGAVFCLKNGVHRLQVIRPRSRQSFYGEGGTVLNGSRLLTSFTHDGRYWIADNQNQEGEKHGECLKAKPACSLPEQVFIDDQPLDQVLSRDGVAPGRFFLDHDAHRLYLADDPTGRKVEITVAAFAFESAAKDVLISNITIEKYASVAQKGAVHAQIGSGWIVEHCEVRLNSGAGIAVGTGSQVRDCNIHDNGQIGIKGVGRGVVVEDNIVWANNTHGFDPGWEAGGVKLAKSDGATFKGNRVYDNIGAGIWCDIGCHDAIYEANVVERNHGVGLFHEISFDAVMRDNIVAHNGIGSSWYWNANIVIAASENVQAFRNIVTTGEGGCGIVLIDQGRRRDDGGEYKTRGNAIHDNDMMFEGDACAGGVSDVAPQDENFSIIALGGNAFDGNTYRLRSGIGRLRFVWGRDTLDFAKMRQLGLEARGRIIAY